MLDNLTRVETISIPNSRKISIRFGNPLRRKKMSFYRGEEYYEPGQLVGYVHWLAGEYGARLWHFIVFRTISASGHSTFQQISGVSPGAEILLDVEGRNKVRQLFNAIDYIEGLGLNPADISSSYYSRVHQRLTANQSYHRYTMEQHLAYLKECEVGYEK